MDAQLDCFEWKDEYSMGIPHMDEDHKVLISLLNRCINLESDEESAKHEIDVILDEMMKYANFHFHREELMMEEYGYPHIEDHKIEHQQFVIYIEQTIARYEDNELTAKELLNFLKHWLKHHILEMDKDYSSYFKEEGKLIS